ncbi:class I SAM-dependent methyltransferase [Paenibacillus cymbidii]|uniref:class I SAM-dependent methyltransferase n=1 Tax=Paenibacillus cymbidii TaxID=1639034 RepID=UPI0010800AB4|nr:class I SAM-dependent methyltransferase [Paenibacillus cymbidii]
MKQNKYDDPAFFAAYGQMSRSAVGLDAAGEWPALRALLPELRGKRVLDLGCGYGWHCRYAREQQALSALGVDISESMLAKAREMTDDPAISYRRQAIEDIELDEGAYDAALSSLALHYVERFDAVCRQVYRGLAPGGSFVLSVEHPIFTSRDEQDWHYGPQGERLHWPVDGYQDESVRRTRFLGHEVVKYHRTASTYVNTLLDAGFRIDRLSEPQPTPEMLASVPEMKDETRRPIFLLIAASKSASNQ